MKICEKCGVEFKTYFKIDGKYRNLTGRRFCIECSPFGSHNTRKNIVLVIRICKVCGSNKVKKGNYCPSCLTRMRRSMIKLAAIKYKGGSCVKCGFSGHPSSFEFHHTDPSDKDFEIGQISNRRWDLVKSELDKCEMLCANCHRAIHSKQADALMLEAISLYKGSLDF